jgi:hypothetical protein
MAVVEVGAFNTVQNRIEPPIGGKGSANTAKCSSDKLALAEMSRLKVFLSYSHNDAAVQMALTGALIGAGFDVRTDTARSNTPELHREISINLNWSDVVVPIITADWLKSHECRDEMIRANERRKMIIPFRHRDVTDDGPPSVPWYLKANLYLYVVWQNDQLPRAIDDLIKRLRDVEPDSWQSQCYLYIRELGDCVQKAQPAHRWQSALSSRILGTARTQVSKVLASTECVLSVSHEHSYLRFAQPIFSDAKTIIAICIARISTFWISPDSSTDAGNYLSEQRGADSICRLFVFDSVSELMRFRPILDKHHNSYGKSSEDNGVFICSSASYRTLLQRWGIEPSDGALRQDFGILSFGDQSAQGMYATLDNREFRYTMYDEDDQNYVSNRRVIEYFAKLRKLKYGEFDEHSEVARWSPEWTQLGEQFALSLEQLFQNPPQSVTHVVLLRPETNNPELFHHLQTLASYFHLHRAKLRINSVSIKCRCDMAVIDARYASPLLLWQDFDYLLIVEFDDTEALKHYYQHELHSVEREKLYILLNPRIQARFEEASKLGAMQVQTRSAIFAEIENKMTSDGYVRRIDVRSDDPLRYLLARMT